MTTTTMKQQSSKKSMLPLLLPLLALPFLAFAFWALGGGQPGTKSSGEPTGLNVSLPDAHLPDDSAMDKMSFYEQQEKGTGQLSGISLPDSLSPLTNPEMEFQTDGSEANLYDYNGYKNSGSYKGSSDNTGSYNEREIRSKMKELQESLQEAEMHGNNYDANTTRNNFKEEADAEKVSQLMTNGGMEDAPDPEMEKLQAMMNRIYDIQHPDEVANRLQKQSEANRGVVFPVSKTVQPPTIHLLSANNSYRDSSLGNKYPSAANGFFGLSTKEMEHSTVDKGITAIVQGNTTVVNGASVKLRLLEEVYVNGISIPAGNFLTGQAQLSNDRIIIEVTTILYNQSVFQVKLTVFDTDGMQGLYVPNSINREVLKQSGDNAMQGLGITSLDPSIGAQAAAAGIETAKTLFSRKLKLTKVFLKTGHKVILKSNQQ